MVYIETKRKTYFRSTRLYYNPKDNPLQF